MTYEPSRIRKLADEHLAIANRAANDRRPFTEGESARAAQITDHLSRRYSGSLVVTPGVPKAAEPEPWDEALMFSDVAACVLHGDVESIAAFTASLSDADSVRAFAVLGALWVGRDEERASLGPLVLGVRRVVRDGTFLSIVLSWQSNLTEPLFEGDRSYLVAMVALFQRQATVLRSPQ